MDEKEHYKLSQLTRKNWHIWKVKALNYICSCGIPPQWLLDKSKLTEPLIPKIPGAPVYGDKKESDNERENWNQVVAKVYRVLTNSISNELSATHKNILFGDLQTLWKT